MGGIIYLAMDDVLALHESLYTLNGERPVPLIAAGKLESAVLRPASEAFGEEFFPTLAEKAAALLQGIAIAHPFLDGNKRAALGSMLLFLRKNGVTFRVPDDPLYDFVIAVTTGELREVADIAARLRELFTPHLDGR
jgi:death-on-curing protein